LSTSPQTVTTYRCEISKSYISSLQHAGTSGPDDHSVKWQNDDASSDVGNTACEKRHRFRSLDSCVDHHRRPSSISCVLHFDP